MHWLHKPQWQTHSFTKFYEVLHQTVLLILQFIILILKMLSAHSPKTTQGITSQLKKTKINDENHVSAYS